MGATKTKKHHVQLYLDDEQYNIVLSEQKKRRVNHITDCIKNMILESPKNRRPLMKFQSEALLSASEGIRTLSKDVDSFIITQKSGAATPEQVKDMYDAILKELLSIEENVAIIREAVKSY